jgi:PAS domain S-box-containing protein
MRKEDGIFRTLLESAAEGIVIVDVKGRIVMVNGKGEELFGFRQEELLGQAVEVLLPESRREVHRQHRADYLTDLRNRPMGIGLDLVGRRRDGGELPVEIALSHAGEGDEMLIMASVNDITQRKQWEEEKTRFMEDRIRELEETLSSLAEIARPPGAAVTARMMGVLPLREAASGAFAELSEAYGGIMDEALEKRMFKDEGNHQAPLEALAARLGFLGATPRDVVDLHSRVLKEKGRAVPAARLRGYVEEGHFLLVELIGYLATYYRNRAFSSKETGVRPHPGAPERGGKDGR